MLEFSDVFWTSSSNCDNFQGVFAVGLGITHCNLRIVPRWSDFCRRMVFSEWDQPKNYSPWCAVTCLHVLLLYFPSYFPTANLLGFNLWDRGLVARKCMPPKKMEQSWNLAGTFRCLVANLCYVVYPNLRVEWVGTIQSDAIKYWSQTVMWLLQRNQKKPADQQICKPCAWIWCPFFWPHPALSNPYHKN